VSKTAELLSKLVGLQPGFATFQCEGTKPAANQTDDATAVFIRFSEFFRKHHGRMTEQEVRAIAAVIAWCEGDEELRHACYTGLLQNIADDPPDATLDPFLPPEAIDFMAYWRKPK
jgi:hypothetical protein